MRYLLRSLCALAVVLGSVAPVSPQSWNPQDSQFSTSPGGANTCDMVNVQRGPYTLRTTLSEVIGGSRTDPCTAITASGTGPISRSGTFRVVVKTTDYAVTAADSGVNFTNPGAVAPQTYTLPPGATGLQYCFSAFADGQPVNIVPQAGAVIQYGNQDLTEVTAVDSLAKVCIDNSTSTSWAIRSASGDWNFLYGYQYVTPSSGDVVGVARGTRNTLIDPSGGLVALSVALPLDSVDGFEWSTATSQAILTLTVASAGSETVLGGSVAAAAGFGGTWKYRAANTTWYRWR